MECNNDVIAGAKSPILHSKGNVKKSLTLKFFSGIFEYMENLKVSVVIPTYNRKSELKKLLDALKEEEYPFSKFEVIVVDDGSQDGTKEFLESYKSPFRLIKIVHNKNRGSAASRNDGIKAANNEIILFLDDDLIPVPCIVSNHIKHHHIKNCAVIGNIIYRKTFNTRWVSRYLSTRGIHKIKPNKRIPFKCFWTSNASIRKEYLIKVGLFDENFKIAGGEDTEIAYRLEKNGVEFLYEKEALCFHKPVSLSELLKKHESFAKNALPLLIKKDALFKKVFKLNLLTNPFIKLSLLPFVYCFVVALASIMNLFYLPPFIIDYLLFYKRVH
ncbi:MAG: glycosyltransferase [Candidatus Cloacimonadota bacterium]|nr:MAG: glycosyltransferase [Candidatus Cloacimonadota bacterium]